jgi:hypothetical protein
VPDYLRDFIVALKRPRNFLLAGLAIIVWLIGWYVGQLVQNTAYDATTKWLTKRSDLAMRVLHFIAAHWWWIPWGLVPLTIIAILAWTAADARKAARNRMIPVEHLEDRDLHDQAKAWLKYRLSDKALGIKEAFLFGSVIHDHYPTSDVDLGVVLQRVPDKRLARIGRDLKGKLATDFKHTFGHSLHISFFVVDEGTRLADFLAKAGEHEPLD